ncbi:FAD-dependent oxidoreductase [bacterium]|jgi:protoporphyrinogen oxidase|nr:FAD-dependent oxidoreductase [bacterium]
MEKDKDKTVIIAGAGLRGLSAAYYLCKKGVSPIVFSPAKNPGGILQTVKSGENIFDVYPKNLALQSPESLKMSRDLYPGGIKTISLRPVFFTETGFKTYPENLMSVIKLLGIPGSLSFLLKRFGAPDRRRGSENTLEYLAARHIGERLYGLFIRAFLEKMFGAPCKNLSPFLWANLSSFLVPIEQNGLTSGNNTFYPDKEPLRLTDRLFLYLKRKNTKFIFEAPLKETEISRNTITKIVAGTRDYFPDKLILAYPVHNFINSIISLIPQNVRDASSSLRARNLLCVNILINAPGRAGRGPVFISNPGIGASIAHFFFNAGRNDTCSGITLLYFCDSKDELWDKTDEEITNKALYELKTMALAEPKLFIRADVHRFEEALPVYEAGFEDKINIIKNYFNRIKNIRLCDPSPVPGFVEYEMASGIKAAKSAVESI